jgi:transcriptional regulator of arginine metabolism
MMVATARNIEPGGRLGALRRLLETGAASTQEELCEELGKLGFDVTQSTVSRSLRKIGAVKALDDTGRTVYRMPVAAPPPAQAALSDLVLDIATNGSIIVIHTPPGTASLVARHLDHRKPAGILGTLAGDDTIFVAPASSEAIARTMREIRESLLSP